MGLEMNRAALERQMQDGLTSLNTELTQRCGQHDAEVSSLGSAHLSSRSAWGSTQPGTQNSPPPAWTSPDAACFRWRGWRRHWRRGAIA